MDDSAVGKQFVHQQLLHMRKNRHFLTCILLLVTIGLHAQIHQITGKVTDATGTPVPAATIKIKGSKAGTSADFQGVFTVNVAPNAELIISGIGYETKEVKIGNSTTLTIQLNSDSKSLSEVVVTGTGVATSKKKLGISVEAVSASQLPATPSSSIDQALIGKIPGAQISSTSGNPGDPVNILLRGINSIQGGTQPLIMLDGIQVRTTDINSLDFSTIDRVEVVQGAASAALYGAQGANGVIQLFSKKGRKGTPAINFSTSYSANSYINTGHVNKTKLHPYLTDANNNIVDGSGTPVALNNAGVIPVVAYTYGGAARSGIYNPLNINDKPYNANVKWYDHFKEVFQTGTSLNNSINISGAGDKTDYAIGVSNNHTLSPVMKNGYVDRTNLTANIGTELFKGFRLRSITQVIYTKNTMVPGLGGAGGVGYGYGNIGGNVGNIFSWLNTPAFYQLNGKLADGTYPAKQESGNYLGANAFNPYFVKEYASGVDNRVDILQNFAADYTVNKFLSLDAKFGINYRTESNSVTYLNQSTNINSDYYSPQDTLQGPYAGAYAPDSRGEIDKYHYENTFKEFVADAYFRTDWEKDFHSKLPITTSTQGGFDYRKTKYTEYDFYGVNLPIAPPINVLATGAQGVADDYVEPFVTYGFLFNQIIDYGDFGGVAGGFRSDFSSAFGQGSKAFTFPHVNAYFTPSSFKFWEESVGNTLSFFKVRAAYGQAGIQPGAFQRYPVINQGDLGTNLVYSVPGTLNNPDLGVEVSTEKEIGADLTISAAKNSQWLSQINLSGTYWKRKSDHVIWTVNTAPSLGSTGELTNAITLHSNGIQLSLNMPVYKSRNFSWDFTVNFGHEISVLDNIVGENEILLTSNGGTSQVLQPGTKIGQISGYKAITSVDELNHEGVPYIDKANVGNYTVVNGRVVDTAKKAIQFTNETYALGDGNPKFNASFINGFNYKGILILSFQFDWIYGAHRYNQTKEWMYRDGIHSDFSKPVNLGGQNVPWTAYWASAYYDNGSGNGNDAARDFFYEGASFLRLRNLALAFDAASIMKVKGIKKFQLVLTGRNIWTKTKYTGMDPEMSSGGTNSAWDRVVDQSTIPNVKSYQVGLNVGF
jgi:TonB-dependent starch-binding outer membrane protein SusC